MKRVVSLRWRLVAGSALWTGGLVLLVNQAAIQAIARGDGAHFHFVAMFALALGCMALGLFQVERGMASLRRLRERLVQVRQNGEARIPGQYPGEVQPLVDELNALLEQREQAIARAQSRAGDLAHGLKTPLAVLGQLADRDGGAAGIAEQVDRMRRQIDYHLAHARATAAAADSGARCRVGDSVAALARTLDALYADRRLVFDVHVPEETAVRVRRQDLDELLGNLLDNACQWARSRVSVRSTDAGGVVEIVIDDDGPGLDEGLREAVLRRGIRADETGPGSGLGLAIVRDLAELHRGSIALERAAAGGLRARLRLPSTVG